MQENIIEHLKEVYKPNVIILHGSRARGKERPHSDWDFILLYADPANMKNGREIYKNQSIEFSSFLLPVNVDEVEGVFSTKLQEAKVVYEENGEGTGLLSEAISIYAKGIHWSSDRVNSHRLWMQGRINGMKDSIDNPVMFSKYHADLYQRIFNYWYWISQNSYSQPIYNAVEEVGEKDPEYYRLVTQLIDGDSAVCEKILAAEQLRDRLFQE